MSLSPVTKYSKGDVMNKKQRKARVKRIKANTKYRKKTGYANIMEEAYANLAESQRREYEKFGY